MSDFICQCYPDLSVTLNCVLKRNKHTKPWSFFPPCSFRGISWPPTHASPASTSTGRARQTRWKTAKTWTRPRTSAGCCPRPAYQERCQLLDRCRTTPWTVCSGPDDEQGALLTFTFVNITNFSNKTTDVPCGHLKDKTIWDIFFSCVAHLMGWVWPASVLLLYSFLSHTRRSAQPEMP